MSFEKENFLRTRLIRHLQQLDPGKAPLWGKMSVHQMIEHLSEAIRIASGRTAVPAVLTPPEKREKMMDFLLSERRFGKNLRNPLLGEEPSRPRFNTVQAAIAELHGELIYFFQAFENKADLRTRNPIFGDLDFEQNVQLLYKHAMHHLRQFGTEPI